MLILTGCILSFILGAGCVLITRSQSARESYANDALREQWEEFLNYSE